MSVVVITSKKQFDEFVKNGLVAIDFFATWCGPCKVISPRFEQFSETYSNVKFCKVDVDEVPEVAEQYEIKAMPTFYFFKDGQKNGEVIGANTEKVENEIKNLLNI